MSEYVGGIVLIPLHQIRGIRIEGDETAIITDGGCRTQSSPWRPLLLTLTISVLPVWRSWTKMLKGRFPPAIRFVAAEPNATKRPSALIAEMPLASFPSVPSLLTLTTWSDPGRMRQRSAWAEQGNNRKQNYAYQHEPLHNKLFSKSICKVFSGNHSSPVLTYININPLNLET